MPHEVKRFSAGILFSLLYTVLKGFTTIIFRTTSPLSNAVGFVILFLGQALSVLPLVPIAWRNWTVTSPGRWTLYILVGLIAEADMLVWRKATDLMPLGAFSAISGSGFLFSPALTAALRRRCFSIAEAVGIAAALIGLLLVTHPPFLFNEPVNAPGLAYLLAIVDGVITLGFPYFYGVIAEDHWSNFLVLRTFCGFIVAGVCFGVAGGPSAFFSAPLTASAGVAVVGFVSTVYRLTIQVGCSELEAFDRGLAGLLGNLAVAGVIPTTTLLSAAFYGESLTVMEAIGVGLVFGAIVVVSLAKKFEKREDLAAGK